MSMPGVVTHRKREDDKLEAILSFTVTFYLKKKSQGWMSSSVVEHLPRTPQGGWKTKFRGGIWFNVNKALGCISSSAKNKTSEQSSPGETQRNLKRMLLSERVQCTKVHRGSHLWDIPGTAGSMMGG